FHLFRSPGPGLGNLLFPWARAVVCRANSDGHLISPTWRNIKLGPWLRGEADKRTYGDVFKHRPLVKWLRDLKIKARRLREISEHEYYDFIALGNPTSPVPEPTLVVFEGMASYFSNIAGHGDLIRSTLRQECRIPVDQAPPHIAVHVRLSDFVTAAAGANQTYARNTRVDLAWYESEIRRVKELYRDLPIRIYTDDRECPGIRKLASLEGASVVTPTNALVDMLKMSEAAHIVLSTSTFSLWAAFLSKATVSATFREVFDDYRLRTAEFDSRII
ncbi:MAG: alpha-1,2-fucosyltransferase, partial [Methylocella sp.]